MALGALALVGPSAIGATAATEAPASTRGALTSSSSAAPGASAAALLDGDVPHRALGAEWSAAAGDGAPWVQLSWPEARRIASVQVFGSTADATDPTQPNAAALYGVIRFSDGSSLPVSGIAAGGAMPTTVAFAPRATTSVRLELRRQVSGAPVALRELTAYAVGSTPPRWDAPASSPTYAVTPPRAGCSSSSSESGRGTTTASVAPVLPDRLSLACPTPGSSTGVTATVVLNAPAGAAVSVWAATAASSSLQAPLRRVATATADASGHAVLTADVSALPRGPYALKATATSSAGRPLQPLYVQLLKDTGAAAPHGTDDHAPAGMTLQYSDEFTGPLSATQSGWGAQYAAIKPEPGGGSQFGSALFADPADGANTLATVPGGFLRVRAQPIGSLAPKATWGQPHAAGILSSQRYGGSGFSAQQGYFEARMLGAPGAGAWPAFWMLNSESGTPRSDGKTSGELDAIEMYGHNPTGGCHTTHAFGAPKGSDGKLDCRWDYGRGFDWAAQWHTYGVQVMPDGSARFFVDGRQTAHLDQLGLADQPFFFLLDLATGGGYDVDLAATGQVSDLYVDWVRVYT
ncbi:Beta-glucanase, GH16 family [Quadrisphaera granulorum]|uniref:Beta-glucanase (GH16 family) n=1 Tax=Quadrisphaera granulorum TaxID=317664 RepID=A0A316ABZ9_9ACTN|nr:glycoside hydrolase family 16 protein [Quadrisphaera granulorum]PWJ55112.1 beta-glucanase (GH16 family) [Quadrisphaera granulorum]SZE95621.1 Beta-glucanase, GH16 family [Quadrisphaera granulorum]